MKRNGLSQCVSIVRALCMTVLCGGLMLTLGFRGPRLIMIKTQTSGKKVEGMKHVIALRVPKTGTSTTTFVYWRYALNKNLQVLLPKPNMEESYREINEDTHELDEPSYDIMANQLIYNRRNFAEYFPNDTVYIAQVRYPLDHVASSIYYIHDEYIRKVIPGDNKLETYLEDPRKYEKKFGNFLVSLTNNPLASFFGLKREYYRNKSNILEFVAKLDREFTVVLILERLDESLVMLKRTLNWDLKDIIYLVGNVNKEKPKIKVTSEALSRHRQWCMADYAIYEHFAVKLDNYVRRAGPRFQQEVDTFKLILQVIWTFCDQVRSEDDSTSIPESEFSEEFIYTSYDCKLLDISGKDLRNLIRKRQGLVLE